MQIYNEYVLIDDYKIPIINVGYPNFLDYIYRYSLFVLDFPFDCFNDLISFLKPKIKTPSIIKKHFLKFNEDLDSLSNTVVISFKPSIDYTKIIFEYYDFLLKEVDRFEINNSFIIIGDSFKLKEYSIAIDLRKILKFLETFKKSNTFKKAKDDIQLEILEEGIRFKTVYYNNVIAKIRSNKEEILKILRN